MSIFNIKDWEDDFFSNRKILFDCALNIVSQEVFAKNIVFHNDWECLIFIEPNLYSESFNIDEFLAKIDIFCQTNAQQKIYNLEASDLVEEAFQYVLYGLAHIIRSHLQISRDSSLDSIISAIFEVSSSININYKTGCKIDDVINAFKTN